MLFARDVQGSRAISYTRLVEAVKEVRAETSAERELSLAILMQML